MENNINVSEKKRGSFNVADAVIIIVILALAFGVFRLVDPFHWFTTNDVRDVNIRYVVKLTGIDNDVNIKDNIKKGMSVMNSSTEYSIGNVEAVNVRDASVWEYVEDSSEMTQKTIEGKSDVYITVTVKATFESGVGYEVNGQRIAVGTTLDIRLSGFVGSGCCVELEEIK